MCGILGVVFRDPRRRADERRVIEARNSLTHRGPDEAGLWVRPGVALAHRRLKVLDLTHGQQPMVGPDEHFALVYNGEVYNYRDLRSDLRRDGARFTGSGDTEVVFESLNRHGPDALDGFNGMFAFGHWDQRGRRLLLARDRIGKKPLYWFADGELLVFASELKALLVYLDRKFDVDPVALDQFFARGYVLSPRTIFRGVRKLPAGHRLVLDAKAWAWREECYWDFTPRAVPANDADALDELDGLLTDAVRVRLVSDVPIGCLLSGGIDSSLVTALAAKAGGAGVKAFSIGFDESAEHNELPYAERVARRHKCDWFSRSVRGGDFLAMLDEAAPFYDEPFGNFTIFSMRRLAQLAREQLVVVLTGNGGDELSAGYPGRYNWVVRSAQAAADRRAATRYAAAVDDPAQYLRATGFVPWAGGRDAIFSHALRDEVWAAADPLSDLLPFWNRAGNSRLGRLNNVLYADVKTNLADYLICLEERMTMSVSLEARNPLLDHRVVEFLLSLPESMKIRSAPGTPGIGGPLTNKWVLQQLARRYVPAEAIDRPKRGFTPPLATWLTRHADAIAGRFRASEPQTRTIYAPAWREYLARGRYEPATLMPVYYSLMLSAWAEHYGKYVASWPGEADLSRPAVRIALETPALRLDDPWQRTLRQGDPAAMGEARWFCQMLANLAAGTRVAIAGDEHGWFAFLARECGMEVVEAGAKPQAAVVVGLEEARAMGRERGAAIELPEGAEVLLFAPFGAEQSGAAKGLIEEIADRVAVKGFQGVAVAADRAVMIVRGEWRAAVAVH